MSSAEKDVYNCVIQVIVISCLNNFKKEINVVLYLLENVINLSFKRSLFRWLYFLTRLLKVPKFIEIIFRVLRACDKPRIMPITRLLSWDHQPKASA